LVPICVPAVDAEAALDCCGVTFAPGLEIGLSVFPCVRGNCYQAQVQIRERNQLYLLLRAAA
jgi:hypothetical protein